MGQGTQGYLGELYLKTGSFKCNELIKIGSITNFTLKISISLKDISTHGFLAKNKRYRNFDWSFKTWSVDFKNIYIDDTIDGELLDSIFDDAVTVWIKLSPNRKQSLKTGKTIFIGKALINSKDFANSLSAAVENSVRLLGVGPIFKLKEFDDCVIRFETGCIETAIANGCDLSQIGTTIANVDAMSIISPPVQPPNLSLPYSSFSNVGTQYAKTPPNPTGWYPLGDQALVGSGQATFTWYSGDWLKDIWELAGYAKPPNYPSGYSWTGSNVISAVVPGSYFWSTAHGNKFEPISYQRSYLVPIDESKHCLIDAGLGQWRYNCWIMLITEFSAHSGPTLGKRYSLDLDIVFYDKDRIEVDRFKMPNYSIHDATAWYDPAMSGSVPLRSRYWRIYLKWNNPDGIASNNFYGAYGYFLDYRNYDMGLRFSF